MRYSSLAVYIFGIIIFSGCHYEHPVIDTSVPSTASSPPENSMKKRELKQALVIGINNYSDQKKESGLGNLWYAVNDSLAIKTRLESMGFKVSLLRNEDATKKNILKQFKKYKQMDRNSQLIIFYSGHGITDEQEGYIISADGERISFKELRNNTFFLPPKHILYILDSCHSGFLDPAVQTKWPVSRNRGRGKRIVPQQQQERESKPAVYTLTAGSSKEKTKEGIWLGHSYFTRYLLKGLDGVADIDNDCKITASELGVYLTQVIRLQDKTPQGQHPLFNRVFGEGEITFIPPRCQNDLRIPRQQQLVSDKKWETSDAYKGLPSTYDQPTQLLVDSQNNLYVLDTPARKVYKFDAEGKYIRSYDNKNWVPTSMALLDNGGVNSSTSSEASSLWVYYSSGGQSKVVIYEGEKEQRRWGREKDFLDGCVWPQNAIPEKGLIAIDAENNIILADQETGILTKCTIKGKNLADWGEHKYDEKMGEENNYFQTVTQPKGLAVDKFGYIYVADTGGHGIQRYSFDTTWIPGWINAKGDSPYFFNSPHGVAVDANFHVYIADTNNDRIKKYTSDGKKLLACWGKQCWGNQDYHIDFNRPQGVAVSLGGRFMYVADTDNKRVRKFFFSKK